MSLKRGEKKISVLKKSAQEKKINKNKDSNAEETMFQINREEK